MCTTFSAVTVSSRERNTACFTCFPHPDQFSNQMFFVSQNRGGKRYRRGTHCFGCGSCVTRSSTPLVRSVCVATVVVGHLTPTLISNLLGLKNSVYVENLQDSIIIPNKYTLSSLPLPPTSLSLSLSLSPSLSLFLFIDCVSAIESIT